MVSQILRRFRWKFAITLFLIVSEAALVVLFPLFIGRAIDDILVDSYQGIIQLGLLGLGTLLFGAGRRFFDTRFYAKVYEELGMDTMSQSNSLSSSKKTARLSMLRETVEFCEFYVPAIINSLIGLVGVLIIIAALHFNVFLGCLVVVVIVLIVYWITGARTLRYNKGYNDEMERQLDALEQEPQKLRRHLRQLMRWNIRLSDLESINFSISWVVLMGFLVFSVILVVKEGDVSYGIVFSLIMYLFQFIESLIALPAFYQQWLRLREISSRFQEIQEDD